MKIHKSILARYALFALATGATLNAGAEDSHLPTDAGAPVGDNQNSQTAGPSGPVVLQDSHLIEKLQRFDRERGRSIGNRDGEPDLGWRHRRQQRVQGAVCAIHDALPAKGVAIDDDGVGPHSAASCCTAGCRPFR